jgi:hypothetical protein
LPAGITFDDRVDRGRRRGSRLLLKGVGLLVRHAPSSCGSLLLPEDAVLRDRDRGRGELCSTWIAGSMDGLPTPKVRRSLRA